MTDYKNNKDSYWLILFNDPWSNDHDTRKFFELTGTYEYVKDWMSKNYSEIKGYRVVPWPEDWSISDACISASNVVETESVL